MKILKRRSFIGHVFSLAAVFALLAVSTQAWAQNRTRVAGGFFHTLYLDVENNVVAMGRSLFGQTGPYAPPESETYSGMAPVHVGIKARVIAAAGFRSAAIRPDGSGVWWGMGTYGQAQPQAQPVPVLGTLIDIAMTTTDLYLLSERGEVYSWDFNPGSPPELVAGLSQITELDAGYGHVVALARDGGVWTLGHNNYGQLGNGTTTGSRAPVMVSGLQRVSSVAAGEYTSYAVMQDGTVRSWGRNRYGMLGNGDSIDSSVPVTVANLYNVHQIAAGGMQTLAVMLDGTVYAWGWHNYIGNGGYNFDALPRMIIELSQVHSVAAGGDHTLAIDTYGQIWGWGGNLYGKLGDGTNTERHQPVAALAATRLHVIEVLPEEPKDGADEVSGVGTPVDTPAYDRPGYGYGDRKHRHCGPRGRLKYEMEEICLGKWPIRFAN